MNAAAVPFSIFVYGTLKQGERNFDRYCHGVLSIEPACVWGRLYYLSAGHHLTYGYPMLKVPPEHILAIGSDDYQRDASLPSALAETSVKPADGGDWELIAGEVHTFDDPLTRFRSLDALEDFRPGHKSLYHRVALRLHAPAERVVWTYIAADGHLPADAVRIGPCWMGK
jgi:gamma-glutamylcyclotransferase (GGCT)/AIG2-like uncharacterized protein YtfP